MEALLLITFVASLLVGFLLSGMEAGVFALSRLRIRHQMRRGNPRARRLYGYLENSEDFLWTILVGNTIANFLAVSIGVIGLYQWLGRWPVALVLGLLVAGMVFYSLSELLPKMLFRLYPNALCLWMAPPFRAVHVVLRPLVLSMAWFSARMAGWFTGRKFTGRIFGDRQELRSVIQESTQEMNREERAMIQRVLNLQNLALRQITVPMAHVVTATARTPVRELLALFQQRGFSRLPVWNEGGAGRRIIGLLNLNRLLFALQLDQDRVAGDFVKPALYLEADVRLEAALRQMQRTGHRVAIVVEPDRRELGIVSLQDILRVIFGEVAF